MNAHPRLTVFSLAACIAYTASYYFDWPLLRYYLGSGDLSFSAQPETAGAPILWYGWILTAGLAALVLAVFAPRAFALRMPPDLLWIIPAAATLAAVLYEVRWFI